MKLTFPRVKLLEVEVVEGEPVDAHDGKCEVEIFDEIRGS
jgi:hypothetical protein